MDLKRISVNDQPLPRGEQKLLVQHKYGIDYICFWNGAWRFGYTGTEVEQDFPELIGNITHFYIIPQL